MALDTNLNVTALKSPKHKLIAFFRRSRDAWKKKYSDLKKQLKFQENKVRILTQSRAMWRDRAKVAERKAAEAIEEAAPFRAAREGKKKARKS